MAMVNNGKLTADDFKVARFYEKNKSCWNCHYMGISKRRGLCAECASAQRPINFKHLQIKGDD